MRIDLGLFSLRSLLGIWTCYYYHFYFSVFSSKIFVWAFSFCLKGHNILLSGLNYGSKFNFIGIKKIESGHKFF